MDRGKMAKLVNGTYADRKVPYFGKAGGTLLMLAYICTFGSLMVSDTGRLLE